jgi:hypothetical protein
MDDQTVRQIIVVSYGSDNTRKNYLSRLSSLQTLCNGDMLFNILANPGNSFELISNKYTNINTLKNTLTLILALFKNSTQLRDILCLQHKEWLKYHDQLDNRQKEHYDKNAPTQKQMENYTSMQEIKDMYNQLKNGESHKTLQDSQRLVLLSIIVFTPPKRNDYANMRIYQDGDPKDGENNYLVLQSMDSYMVFNKYKTSNIHKSVIQVLPNEVIQDIKASLMDHPRTYLFVNRFQNPYKTNDAFSKFVFRSFQHLFNKETGTTLLRHMYITENVSWDDMTDEELKDLSKLMLHTPNGQRLYHWKKKFMST